MIDNFALGLSHGLMLLAVWRLIRRPDLDDADAPPPSPASKPDRSLKSLLKGRLGA